MRYSTAMIVAAIGIGEAMAGPAHTHFHKKAHQKKDVDWSALDWSNMGIDWAAAYSKGQGDKTEAVAAPAATPAAAAVVATPVAAAVEATATEESSTNVLTSVSESISDDISDLFAGLVGFSNKLTSFGEDCGCVQQSSGDFAMGQVGSPYGSNIIKVDSTSGYDFTNTFKNTQSKAITVNIWNKVGHDMQPLSGSALAPTQTALTFVLPAGESQIVAFMENSQVGWAEACSKTAASGAYATTWGEANFLKAGSGYDMSAIMNPAGNNYNMGISSVEAPACTSDMTQNYWLTATEPIGTSDGSCFIAQSTAHLTTIMGGSV